MIDIRYQNDCNHKIWFLSKTALTSIWIRLTFAHLVHFGYIEWVSIFGQSKTQFYFMKSCFLSNIKSIERERYWLNLFRGWKVGCKRVIASTWSRLNCYCWMSTFLKEIKDCNNRSIEACLTGACVWERFFRSFFGLLERLSGKGALSCLLPLNKAVRILYDFSEKRFGLWMAKAKWTH